MWRRSHRPERHFLEFSGDISVDIGSYSFLPRFWRAPDMGLTVAQIFAQNKPTLPNEANGCRQPHT